METIENKTLVKADLVREGRKYCGDTIFVNCTFAEDCRDIKYIHCRFCGCVNHNSLTMCDCWVFDEIDVMIHQITDKFRGVDAQGGLSPQAHLLIMNFRNELLESLDKYQHRK